MIREENADMKKLKTSTAAKAAAMVLVIISIIVFAASLTGMLVIDSLEGYQIPEEDMLQEAYKEVCNRYSIAAMAGNSDSFNEEMLSDTNFQYGIINARLEEKDLTDLDSYLFRTFDKVPDEDQRHIYTCFIGDDTTYAYGRNIWETYFINSSHEKEWYTQEEYPLDDIYYDRALEVIYVRSGKKLFEVIDGTLYTGTDDETIDQDLRLLNNSYLIDTESGYIWSDECRKVRIGEMLVDMSDIKIVDDIERLNIGSIREALFDSMYDDTIYVSEWHVKENEPYIVVSYIPDNLYGESSFGEGDMFWQMRHLVNFAYKVRYLVIILLILSLGIFVTSFYFLMCAAGYHKDHEGVRPRFLDHLPLDVYLGGAALAEVMLVMIVVLCAEKLLYSSDHMAGYVSFGVISACIGIAAVIVAVLYCMSFAVRVKMGKWWRHTFTFWMCRMCVKIFWGCVRYSVRIMKKILSSMTLLWKAWLLLGGIALADFIITFSNLYMEQRLLFWTAERIVLYPVIIFLLIQMHQLQKGARRIAGGELGYRIHTGRMFWELKKHGEYLNDIGIGINRAVNERLKSEHFKTELITNVSHDIKTPLTSIINYVDLLQKEEIDNPTVQQYLDVLHRQSARLKKLIEDLMEASKASTGSMSVVMEKCDTGVMLVQTVGEFEEKLMENQIELQIKRPDESILIEADHRHLWRVFDNLMNNICKYAQPLTRAYINLEQDGQRAYIIFRNISKCQLNISSEELMERFVRGDSSRNTEGSGLGISIAKSLTELMNGTFELIVDGDLFKVVLSFPVYGTAVQPALPDIRDIDWETKPENELSRANTALTKITSGIQNAGSRAADIGHGMADKTGRMLRRAGRFADLVRQAAAASKEEDMQEDER